MSLLCRRLLVGWFVMIVRLPLHGADVLRVCADPNNLPFSNRARQGFENELAELLTRDLGMQLEYVWWEERRNFVRKSLGAGKCDAILGVPAMLDSVELTQPYYRSTYVFISRKDAGPTVSSLNDGRLSRMRIGIHLVGNDYAPPALALTPRGLSANLVGFSLHGEEGEENPPARIVDAVRNKDVDIAIAWGPLAGYFANDPNLQITPVTPRAFRSVPFVYEISVAVRKGDEPLRMKLSKSINRQCAAIQKLLANYRVPQVSEGTPLCGSAQSVSASSR